MATIKELKENMQFNAGLIDLLEVMKSAAVFQFRFLPRHIPSCRLAAFAPLDTRHYARAARNVKPPPHPFPRSPRHYIKV